MGQLMVTTLSHRDKGNENDIDIHSDSPPLSPDVEGGGREGGDGKKRRRKDIVLRNMMLDMVLNLLSSSHMELNSKSVTQTLFTNIIGGVWPIKDSLTYHPSSQGWVPRVLPLALFLFKTCVQHTS